MLTAKTVRVSLLDLYLGVICIFPVVTMLIDNGALNKMLFGILLALHIGLLLSKPIKKHTFLSLFVLIVNYLFALCSTTFPMENINLLTYFPFFLLYTYFLCDYSDIVVDWFAAHKMFVSMTIIIWSVLVGISIFIPGCYIEKVGESVYFGSFCGSIFRLGPSAVFIQVLVIMAQLLYGQKQAVVYNLIPMYCYLMGSSRTYLVIGLCLFVISWYFACKKRVVFWCTIVPLMVIALLLVTVSSMGDKIAYTLDESRYGDFWFRITSSRSLLWEQDLKAFSDMPIFNKVFGCGLEFTTQVSGKWGHNDFIEILCSFGIAGLLQYVYSVWYLFKCSFAQVRVPRLVKICAFMAWFFNAFFNMHYVYFCAMLCYPFLLFAVRRYFIQNPMQQKFMAK